VERRRRELEEYFTSRTGELRGRQLNARFVIRQGQLPEAILALAKHEKADLFVMSGHGYGAISRLLLGSVASKLIRSTTIPVLMAKYGVLKKLAGKKAVPAIRS
jgi:nucleotide-binding universal stress UspA family protein